MNRTALPFQKLLFAATFLIFSFSATAQLLQTVDATNNGPYTPQSLISNVFLGQGVEVSNILYNGSPRAVGYFSGGTQSIGIERGILMTTGYAAKSNFGAAPTDFGSFFASNSNASTANDANLAAIATEDLRDVAVYTITFTPTSDTLRFRYCFASEEYPEYSCTSFNDIFGFFIQGPGYPVPTNIARIPNSTLPVAINNIHPQNTQNLPPNTTCPPLNIQYYNDNNINNTMKQPVYDGFTDVFTAMAVVTPCQSYTIKLAIADVFDSAFDSGVFLEAKSFGTAALRVSLTTPSADGSIAEGCSPATINFSLPDARTQNFPINYTMFGTATAGLDFENLPANLMIPAGQTQISIPIQAYSDGLSEGVETIAFSVQTDPCNRDTVYLTIRDNQLVSAMMQDTVLCGMGVPIELNATAPVPTPTPPTFTNTQDLAIPDDYPPVSSNISVTGVQPVFLRPDVVRSVCVNITHGFDDDIDMFLISPGGQVLELSTDNGAGGDNYTNTCFTPDAATSIVFPGPTAPATAAPFTGNFLPEGDWSDLWDTPTRPTNGVWSLQVTDDFQSFPGTLNDWSITFAPSYEITYQWSATPGITCPTCPSNTVSPMVSTTYSVTATDIYGCTTTDDVLVEIAAMTADAAIDDPISCFGNTNGTATVFVNVGGANTYQWSDPQGQTSASATNLASGTYTVTVTNIGGCSATASVELLEPPALQLDATGVDATCFGQSNGSASVQVTGGTGNLQYLWSNGLTTSNPNALGPGGYVLTVTDENGCSASIGVVINQPSAIQLSASAVDQIDCFNGNNGQISLFSSGGVQPVTFNWATGQSTATISNLAAGNYAVTLTDGNGCTATLQQTLTQPPAITAFSNAISVDCFGGVDGELHVDLTGGVPGYTVQWQGPGGFVGTGTDLFNLLAGDYVATVSDGNGCTQTLNSTITEPPIVSINLPETSDTICFNANNGTASVSASGGTPPFSYVWSAGGQTGATATGLSANLYQVTVSDSRGCTETATTKIPQKQELNTFAQGVSPNCHDGKDGSASVVSIFYGITNANPQDFDYSWNTSPPQQGITAINLNANQTYVVTITDAIGCTAQTTVTIGNPEAVEAIITGAGDITCFGAATGWASASATGGTAPYTWFWGTGNTDSIGTGLAAGVNRVTITDARGCPDVVSVTLKEPTPVAGTIQSIPVKCFGEASGKAIVSASGGNAPYSYNWWNGTSTNTAENLAAGSYQLTITDGNGCTAVKTAVVEQPDAALTATADIQEPKCFGEFNGRIILTPAGGVPPYRYALDDQPFNGSPVQIGLAAGIYEPKILDGNGCILRLDPVEVTQQPALSVDLGPDIEILLGQDTQLLATLTHVNGDYNLWWSPGDTAWLSCDDCINPSVYSLQQNHYFEVYVIDSAGCRAEDQILVTVERPRKVFVPTAFSPNGDFTNDLLLVHGQQSSRALVFRVYDRWGEMVYEARDFAFNDENTGWDGTFRGKPMDPGVYVWVLEVAYIDGVKELFKGNTTLIR